MAPFWWLLRDVICTFYGVDESFMVKLENVRKRGRRLTDRRRKVP